MGKKIGLILVGLFLLILAASALTGGNIGIGAKPVASEEQLETVLAGIEGEEVYRYAHYEGYDHETANLYILLKQETGYDLVYARSLLRGGVGYHASKARYVYDKWSEWIFKDGETLWRQWIGGDSQKNFFGEEGMLYHRTLWHYLEDGTDTEPHLYWGVVPKGAIKAELLFSEDFLDTGMQFVVFETDVPLETEIPVVMAE